MNLPDKKYKIIYADPPWHYHNFNNIDLVKARRLGNTTKWKITPYEAMELDDIKKIPVKEISDKDSVLCLWAVYPALQEAFEVIEAWGFNYKTVLFTWIKQNKSGIGIFVGLGNYTRANAEICLVATKGKGCKVLDKTISQIQLSPLTKHSKKPNDIRRKIVKLFGDLPRIELFARTKIHGWDVWGNDDKLNLEPLEAFSQ